MRYLPFVILILLISCTSKTENTGSGYFANMQFSVDTVLIDPGDEIIFLEHDLFSADKSMDDKYLFNFNANDNTLEKINLDDLRLEKKIPFEKEGPNGTGSNVGTIRVHNQNQIIIGEINRVFLFSLDGIKLNTVHYEDFSLGGNFVESGEMIQSSPVLDTEAKRMFVLIEKIKDSGSALGILDLGEYEISRKELQTFEKLNNYRLTLWMGKSSLGFGIGMKIEKFGSKVILSNQITSSLMWYEIGLDSLFMKTYNSQLTADEKMNSYKLEHESEESLETEYRKLHEEINFLPPFWDEKNQIFYRFSFQQMPSESKVKENIKSNIYLSALDKDLNLIGEILVPQLTKMPSKPFSGKFPKHFAKDGKIWIYENINDEMGFVVLTMSN